MAVIGGQTDRFGNKIPPNQSVKVWINADGTVPQQRETVLLDSTITATDDPVTQATKLSVSGAAPVTTVTGTAPITSSGGTTPAIGLANTAVTPGSYTNSSVTVDAQGRLTAASSGTAPVTSVTGTSPIVSSGGATPAISINNTGTTVGRAGQRILVDRAVPSAATTYTSVSWAAGKYSEMILIFRGKVSAFAYMAFQFNADATAANYIDLGANVTSAVAADSADGTNGFARTTVDVTGNIKMVDEVHFFPLTDGNERSGWSIGSAMGSTTLAANTKRDTSFGWRDKATDVTFITYHLSTAATMTGIIELWGIPA